MKQATLRRLISIGMLLVLVVLFTILSGMSFLNSTNLINILRDASVVAIVGVGVTYVIITSGIDLSTGAIMAVVGMVMANVYAYTLWPIPVMLLIGVAVGLICGLVNGFIVGKLHVPEFIATLATMSIYRSFTYIIAVRDANGVIQSQPMVVRDFTVFGGAMWLGGVIGPFYIVTSAALVFIIVGQIVLKLTHFGTNLYSVGASKKAATLSGISISKTQIIAYVVVGLCAAIGSIFTIARLQSATTSIGLGFEFDPIAAAVIGGVSLAGGSGDVIGMAIGAIFMAALDNGVLKLGVNTAVQYIIKGAVIIAVVIFDAVYKKVMDKRAKARGAGAVPAVETEKGVAA